MGRSALHRGDFYVHEQGGGHIENYYCCFGSFWMRLTRSAKFEAFLLIQRHMFVKGN